ncbi:MAG: tRNA-dihydrouridine synthase [Cellulosilyticaceae bacterium]
MKGIYKPFEYKNLHLRNRIVMAPMCTYSTDDTGVATAFHEMHYGARALGGVGAIILEATAVESRGRISGRDLGIWSDMQIEPLARVVACIKAYGAAAGIQLGHAGRKATVIHEDVIAPSAIHFNPADSGLICPRAMNQTDIDCVVRSFKEAARRADEAGFDFIELHGAHGYLISEFLSPLTNHRSDAYGGSMEERSRILIQIIKAVREVFPPEKVVGLRISAKDYMTGGNQVEDLVEVVNLVKSYGVDLVNVSTGAVMNVPVETYPGYQLQEAEIICKQCDLPVMGGGLVKSARQVHYMIETNKMPLVFIGRELLRDPHWVLNQAFEEQVTLDYIPYQYQRGFMRT